LNQNGNSAETAFRSHIPALLCLTFVFFLNFIARIILAPLLPAVVEELGIGSGPAGSLFLLISAGYFAALVASGFVSARLMHRRTIILSAVMVGAASLAVAGSRTLWSLRFSCLLLGTAAGLYLPSGMATLTSLVGARQWGKAVAMHEMAPNMSFVLAPLVAEGLLLWFSWRGIPVILGISAIASGLAFWRYGKGGEFTGRSPNFNTLRTLLSNPTFWIMIALFSLGIGGSLGIYSMLPLYMVTEQGLERNLVNTLVSLSRVPGLGMAFAAGWLNDRFGSRPTLMAVLLLTGLATVFLGLSSKDYLLALVFLQPVMAVCFFPPGFAALSQISSPQNLNMAVSLTVPAGFIFGAGLVPAGIGFMGDWGSLGGGIMLVGGLILSGAMLSFFLRFPERVKDPASDTAR
jgi:NNP family nitrate/nitrite transporter-like MFS transporter